MCMFICAFVSNRHYFTHHICLSRERFLVKKWVLYDEWEKHCNAKKKKQPSVSLLFQAKQFQYDLKHIESIFLFACKGEHPVFPCICTVPTHAWKIGLCQKQRGNSNTALCWCSPNERTFKPINYMGLHVVQLFHASFFFFSIKYKWVSVQHLPLKHSRRFIKDWP